MSKLTVSILFIIVSLFETLNVFPQNDSIAAEKQKLTQLVREFGSGINHKNAFDVYLKLGEILLDSDSVQKADLYFQKALKGLEKLNDSLLLLNANMHIGIQYGKKSHFSMALHYYLLANKYSSNLGPQRKINVLNEIGTLYYDLENYTRAYNYFKECEEIAEQNNIISEIGTALTNIGEVYRFEGKYDEAYNSYMSALEIEKKLGDQLGIAILYNNLALLFLKQKKYDESFSYFSKSQKMVNELGDLEKIASTFTGLGHYYLGTKEYSKAIKSFLKTLAYDLPVQSREDIICRDAYEGLYLAYKSIDDYKNAYKYYHLYNELKEKISSINTQDQLMVTETRFAVEKEMQRTRFYEEIASMEKLKKRRQAIVFYIILVLLVLIVGLLYSTFRLKYKTFKQKRELYEKEKKLTKLEIKNKEAENLRLAAVNNELEASKIISQLQKNYLKMELSHKKRELASLVLHLSSKNEILTQIKENLIRRTFLSQNEKVISAILSEINSNLNLDNDWDTFKLHFEEIHPDFFKRLKEKYPNVTNEELKLCAYLRVNLSSKEIAQLLNITAIAVNKRRNRLRKKIFIDQTVNLYEFMAKI